MTSCSTGTQDCSLMFVHGNAQLFTRLDQSKHGMLVGSGVLVAHECLDASVCLSCSFGELFYQFIVK